MVLKHYYIGYSLNVILIICFLVYLNKFNVTSNQNYEPKFVFEAETPKEIIKEVPREIIREVPKEIIKEVYVTRKYEAVAATVPKISFCPKKFRGAWEVVEQCLPKSTLDFVKKNAQGKKFPQRTIYVIMKGRLGNHMFQMLGTYMFSRLFGTKLVYVTDTIDITQIFPLFDIEEVKIWTIRDKLAKLPRVKDAIGVSPDAVAKEVWRYLKTNNVVVDNYMIDHAYINQARDGRCRKLLKKFFQFNCTDTESAFKYLHLITNHWLVGQSDVRLDNISYVGIQVRRGDYMDKMWVDRGMRIPEKDYFFRAMQYFKDRFKNVIFVVATNDRKWCYDNIITEGVYMSPQHNSPSQDMALLSHCNHTIGSIGSFTLWSSLLSGGIRTVYSISKQREFIPAYGEH